MRKINSSNLEIKIDWISFCINKPNVEDACEYLGLSFFTFKDLRHGGRGYRNMLQHPDYDINIYCNGDSNMGTHFEIKGSAVYEFFDMVVRAKFGEGNPFDDELVLDIDIDNVREVFDLILHCGWFTRLDVAIDDIGTKFFSCAALHKYLEMRCYVAKFKRWDDYVSKDASGNYTGYTIYLGSKENSDMFIRVYDKYLEQCRKQELTCDSWVRWEMVLKDEKADIFAMYIIDKLDIGYCARTVLSGYMRLIVKDDINRSRCSTLPKWQRFIDTVDAASLCLSRAPKTVSRSRNWIDRQVLPTLAGLIRAYNGDMSFLYDNLEANFDRLSERDKKMFLSYGGEYDDH